jgi:hypothetical protein
MKIKPRNLVCYKEKRTQKWIMTTDENNDEILYSLLLNENIDKHSIFIVPVTGLMFGGVWLCSDTHKGSRFSFWDFFEEYETKQPVIKVTKDAIKLADETKKERELKATSKYGFISPDGKYYHCDFQGHVNLASNICFGQFETNNPERYLEEHGWCKIYNQPTSKNRYAVYVGGNYTLTDRQFNKLKELGLEKADNIREMLVKE